MIVKPGKVVDFLLENQNVHDIDIDWTKAVAHIYLKLNQTTKAHEALKKAVRIDPRDPEAFLDLGELLFSTDSGASLEAFKTALNLLKKSNEEVSVELLNSIGILHFKKGEFELAQQTFKEALGDRIWVKFIDSEPQSDSIEASDDPIQKALNQLMDASLAARIRCTSVAWIPERDGAFVAAHADGNLYVYEKSKDGPGDSTFPVIKDQTQFWLHMHVPVRLACHQTRSYRLGLMYMSPMSIAPARLGCLHIIHTSCLVTHIKSYPPHTAPAGYVCPTCSTSIWPPKSVKDSGSRLHSLLKEAIIQTGMEKNVFGNNPVSMSSPPEHLVTKDSVGGNGSAKPSSIDIVEIDAPNSTNHIRSPPSGILSQSPRFLQLYIYDTQNEVTNRLANFGSNATNVLRPQIVQGLI
ncbi:RING/U-box superfamily protein [Artemisia annua]|uniref:RING/U-box superfamily protein n=1 Tax=Artemisia annua TaxID=35608 RepID=A0A2U1KYL7_ARTAN|nr:RING/U-box superfamily protein [Artemisia annua]